MDFTKSLFASNKEFINPIPANTKCVFIADFFAADLLGGAELTTEAIIEKSPVKVAKLHTRDLTPEILNANKDKFWVFTNFASIQPGTITWLVQNNEINYSIVEYDFKYCMFRSPFKHFLETKSGCDCQRTQHGQTVKAFFSKAKKIFWMSEKQRDHYFKVFPELLVEEKNIVQSSTFSDETLNLLSSLRNQFSNSTERKNGIWAIQDSNSWIKNSKETVMYCQKNNIPFKLIGNMSYDNFLLELAKSYGLVFKPADNDTCARLVIESKLLGLKLDLNEFVMHKNEPWFAGTVEECEEYLRNRGNHFWDKLLPLIDC